ncbi:hypothetical protein CUJ83_14475 [Methanocella sp. CWC-04]|uniref:Uncharacterized protein n=1 Tax=Methanooceanicella nereidis TaxID=2052831 RepID=A0AAP2W616_9EURY|nr:hypothetical protein [Methanocella sp. CWC-04]MCD1296205.1 hypothetical protein [Methanocella sp. CWC-04]
MNVTVSLGLDDILFLTDGKFTAGIIKAGDVKRVFIETDTEELVQFLDPEDILAASCFYSGERAKSSIRCMLYLVREGDMPLLVLKKDHPATKRLSIVVSAGEKITLSSCIIPGTHPEQDVLCGKGELDGMTIIGTNGKVSINGPGSPLYDVEPF